MVKYLQALLTFVLCLLILYSKGLLEDEKNKVLAEINTDELIGRVLPSTNQMLPISNFDFVRLVTEDTHISNQYGGVFANSVISQYKVNEDGEWMNTPKNGYTAHLFSDVVYLKNCYFTSDGETPIVKIDVGQYKSATSSDKWNLVWAKNGMAYKNAFSVVGNPATINPEESNGFNVRYAFFDELTMEPKVVSGTANFQVGSNTSYWFGPSFLEFMLTEGSPGSSRVEQSSIVGNVINLMNFSTGISNNATAIYTGTQFQVAMSFRQAATNTAPTINYIPELSARMDFAPPKTTGIINDELDSTIKFNTRQVIPYNIIPETNLTFLIPIDEVLNPNSISLELYNIKNEKITSGWTSTVANGILTIKISDSLAATLRDSIFFDIKFSAKLREDLDIAGNVIEVAGNYYIETENEVFVSSNQIEGQLVSNVTQSRARVDIPVSGIMLEPRNAQITAEDTINLEASIFPEESLNKLVHWTSSDNSVASVIGEDLNATVVGHTPGVATITATTDDGGYTATSTVSVVSSTELQQSVRKVDGRTAEEVNLGDELIYTGIVTTSLMSEQPTVYYKEFLVSLKVDESLEEVTGIKMTTFDGVTIGNIEYDDVSRVITGEINEEDQLDWSEDIIVTYRARVKQNLAFETEIKGEMSGIGSYTNGMISQERRSNQVSSLVIKGELLFMSAPKELNFEIPAKISSKKQKYPLISTSEQLKVKDLRGNGSTWSLKAKMSQVLTHSSGRELPDAVHYRDNGVDQQLALNVEALIYDTVTYSAEEVVVSDRWNNPLEDTGPFVRIQPGEALKGSYSGVIQWSLQDVPGTSVGMDNDE